MQLSIQGYRLRMICLAESIPTSCGFGTVRPLRRRSLRNAVACDTARGKAHKITTERETLGRALFEEDIISFGLYIFKRASSGN